MNRFELSISINHIALTDRRTFEVTEPPLSFKEALTYFGYGEDDLVVLNIHLRERDYFNSHLVYIRPGALDTSSLSRGDVGNAILVVEDIYALTLLGRRLLTEFPKRKLVRLMNSL